MDIQPLGPGDPSTISGYVLQGRLGAGGMGTVYYSTTRGGQPVALKTVHAEMAADPKFRRRFEREVLAARRVRGRYIVPVLDSNTNGSVPWLATEYVPGLSLSRALALHGPLPASVALQLLAGVAEALRTIHTMQVIHRDLKPGNVLLMPNGPAVIDFGIARAVEATQLTGTGTRIGTPSYMAPEQISASVPLTGACDIFALGLTCHAAVTGNHPFGEGSVSAMLYRITNEEPHLSDCPELLPALLSRCLVKDPSARPTASELVELCRETGTRLGMADVLPTHGWLPLTLATPTVQRPFPAPTPTLPPPSPTAWSPPRVPAPNPARRRLTMGLAVLACIAVVGLLVWLLPWNNKGGGNDSAGHRSPPSSSKPSKSGTPASSEPHASGGTSEGQAPPEGSASLTASMQALRDRVAKGLTDCQTATALDQIPGSIGTLRCTAIDVQGVTVRVASFSKDLANNGLEDFVTREKKQVGETSGTGEWGPGENFARDADWSNSEGIRIGRLLSYTDVYNLSHLTWTFENDYFVDQRQETFVVKAEGKDQQVLMDWWLGTPI